MTKYGDLESKKFRRLQHAMERVKKKQAYCVSGSSNVSCREGYVCTSIANYIDGELARKT